MITKLHYIVKLLLFDACIFSIWVKSMHFWAKLFGQVTDKWGKCMGQVNILYKTFQR
jgi:hypothetical protein